MPKFIYSHNLGFFVLINVSDENFPNSLSDAKSVLGIITNGKA